MSWLGDVIKKNTKGLIRNAAGAIAGVVGGPAAGAAAYAGVSALQRPKQGPGTALVTTKSWNPPGIQLPSAVPIVGGMTVNLPGFGPPGFGLQSTGARRGRVQPGPGGECPKGYHLDKNTRTFCTRNRRMNMANGRATSRAVKRVKGTVKLLRRSFSLVSTQPKGTKWRPKGKK